MSANRWDDRQRGPGKSVAPAPPDPTSERAPQAVPERMSPKTYVLAKGRQLLTARGVLQTGDAVRVSDFSDGLDQFEAHIKSGFIVEN